MCEPYPYRVDVCPTTTVAVVGTSGINPVTDFGAWLTGLCLVMVVIVVLVHRPPTHFRGEVK